MNKNFLWIADWAAQGRLPADRVPDALRLAGIPPSPHAWRSLIDRLLLWLGVSALLAGLVFFVAANWSGMGRFAKFAMAEVVIVIALVAYAAGVRLRFGAAALLAASLAVGALLALVGQTYQTGADTFELFLVWALLILPWVLLSRLPALWVLWLAILHVAFYFYVETFGVFFGVSLRGSRPLMAAVLFDGLVLALWEWMAWRGAAQGRMWMQGRWVPRLVALTLGVAVTLMALEAIFRGTIFSGAGSRDVGVYWLLYGAVLAGLYWGYRYWELDLFVLAGGALSVIVVTTTALGRALFKGGGDLNALFVLAVFSMLATAAAAWWLRQLARTQAENRQMSEAGQEHIP